jgi:hypothetical protein
MRCLRRTLSLLAGTLGVAALHACGPVVSLFDEVGKGEDESLTKTCKQVFTCGGIVSETTCNAELSDLIEDGRVTQERAVSCAVCMDDNSCDEIVDRRHCDVACAGISMVENLRTRARTRGDLCDSITHACSSREKTSFTPPGASSATTCVERASCVSCVRDLAATVRSTPSLDAEVAKCAACVAETEKDAPSSMPTERCERFITRCVTACDTVPAVRELFAGAEARFAVEAAVTRLCGARSACGEDLADCTSGATSVLSAPDAGSGAVEQATACGACLEATPCDSPTRETDCAAACARFLADTSDVR